VNGDGVLDVRDVFFLVSYLFAGGPEPLGPADANEDGAVDVGDVFALIDFLFAAGISPGVKSWRSSWPLYAQDPTHRAQAPSASQPLQTTRWSVPVDLAPRSKPVHYGSPLVTPSGNVLVTVKTGATDGFRVEGHAGVDGASLWTLVLDYSVPTSTWMAPCGPALTPLRQVVMPAAGGTVLRRDDADSPSSTVERLAFYGLDAYLADPATYATNVKISTPLTPDAHGAVFFGFVVLGPTSAGLASGIARIGPDGNGSWASLAAVLGESSARLPYNCAPAISADGTTLYVSAVTSSGPALLALDAATFALKHRASLVDPLTKMPASLIDISTAAPVVAPDGDVFYGIYENPDQSNNDRGWLVHYDAALETLYTPGAFGWDSTPSVVPAAIVSGYTGTSPYLLFSKYNNYAGLGTGDGVNRIVVLDPRDSETDPISGVTAMKVIRSKVGPTAEPLSGYPNAVYEWCINSAAVDVAGKSVLVNSEDGKLYRWNLDTDALTESVRLSGGAFEAYTPTLVAPDGSVFAINNKTLYAAGAAPIPPTSPSAP
jgi:hypothetical protein